MKKVGTSNRLDKGQQKQHPRDSVAGFMGHITNQKHRPEGFENVDLEKETNNGGRVDQSSCLLQFAIKKKEIGERH